MSIAAKQLRPEPATQAAQSVDPTLSAGQGAFYAKTVSGVVEAFFKNATGQVIQLTSNGSLIGGSSNFEASFLNGEGATLPQFSLVSIKTDGSIVFADSDSLDGQRPIGFVKTAINSGGQGVIILFGRKLASVVAGLGFVPGDDVYMSETSGQITNTPSAFTAGDDTIIRLGIACMGDNLSGSLATDMILMREVISQQ